MKTEIRTTMIAEKVIPAHEDKITVYIAEDGTEFLNKNACIVHDQYLEHLKHPIIANRKEIRRYWDERPGTVYYIRNKEDLEYLKATEFKYACRTSRFNKRLEETCTVFPALYYYVEDTSGDYDWYDITRYEEYLNEEKSEFDKWYTEALKAAEIPNI